MDGKSREAMCFERFWKRIVPFALAFMLGWAAVTFLQEENFAGENHETAKSFSEVSLKKEGAGQSGNDQGSGICGGSSTHIRKKCLACREGVLPIVENKPVVEVSNSKTTPLRIISKPRATYTDAARQNRVQGVVRVKVTFLASGGIANVTPIEGLPDGLTEEAIAAAKRICFEPAKVKGQPQTKRVTVEYSFAIY